MGTPVAVLPLLDQSGTVTMVWLITVTGMFLDARRALRAVQEEALRQA